MAPKGGRWAWALPIIISAAVHSAGFLLLVFVGGVVPPVRKPSHSRPRQIRVQMTDAAKPRRTVPRAVKPTAPPSTRRRRAPHRRPRKATPRTRRAKGPSLASTGRDSGKKGPPSQPRPNELQLKLQGPSWLEPPPPNPRLLPRDRPWPTAPPNLLDDVATLLNPLTPWPKIDKPTEGGGRVIESSKVRLNIDSNGALTFDRKLAIGSGLTPIDKDADHVRRLQGGGPHRAPRFAEENLPIFKVAFAFDTFGLLFPSQWAKYQELDLFEATRELRAKLQDAACVERLKSSVYDLRKDLEHMWSESSLSTSQKKELLFRRWDECAEAGSPELLLYAMAARATIIEFIRSKLPLGSSGAYSKAELTRLNNRRTSALSFEPYAED